jgi:GNAT superfamily N-acetyltransferase
MAQRESRIGSLRVEEVVAGDLGLIDQIIALADSSRKTLGLMPPTAFRDAAQSKTLLAAFAGDAFVGYALYALPRQYVRLTHLCVSPGYRRHGIARTLVAEISRRHQDRLGIVLKCRRDYPIQEMWSKLGFQPRNEVPGRGKAPSTLVVWWRDHGHPDLFTVAETQPLLQVALDMNVFLDLLDPSRGAASSESTALVADWLTGQVDLVVMPELFREIGRLADDRERRRQQMAARSYRCPPVDAAMAARLVERLTAHMQQHGASDPLEAADRSDIQHLAEASAAGVNFLVTRDDGLIERLSEVAVTLCGVRILRPGDVAVHFDELTRTQVYRPAELLDTEYTVAVVGSGREAELLPFLDKSGGERRREFLSRVRQLAAATPQWQRTVVYDPNGRPVAIYATGAGTTELTVSLLRVQAQHHLADTIARQLLFLLRQYSRELGLRVLRITDPFPSPAAVLAATDDGFFQHDGDLLAFVINLCAGTAAVDIALGEAAATVHMDLPPLRHRPSAVLAGAIEQQFWPVKILDTGLPTFLVSIRPAWSSELFGIPRSLLPRRDLLGISREHVYYRSPMSRGERAPGRILWYVTNDGPGGLGAIVACSRLEEVVVDSPQTLHGRFQHLGVWKRSQVEKVSRHGLALALRFADTELFPHPVPLRLLRQFATRINHQLVFQAPQQVPSELFAAVYREGTSPNG